MSYDLDRWAELVATCPDLEDTPEPRRAATLEQAFGTPASFASPMPAPPLDHDWTPDADGYYTCRRCRVTRLGDMQYATSGETWTIAPRTRGGCRA
jgi:hypothetical protein